MAAAEALSGPSAVRAPSPEPAAPGLDLAPEEELPELDPAEVRSRLEYSARQFRNRRKLLIRGLPPDVVNQDVHDLLADYDLKYCFVDKHKGTASVTLRDGEQAAAALGALRGRRLRGRELRCRLQPPEALLCVANLPRRLSQQRFRELLRPFGGLERCFLVYHPRTGHSKGYGFAEFRRRDGAARARAELPRRRLAGRRLFVHCAEGGRRQLSPQRLHSRCLLVEGLPRGFARPQQLRRLFARACRAAPTFCQVAVGPEGQPRGFAVLEFAAAAAAEAAQGGADGALLGGSRLRVSFCAPGPPGRSMLAALIAAETPALSPGRGLLPEPNLLPLLGSPSALQLLLNPLLPGTLGGKQGLLGAAPSLPLLPPPALSTALLQLALQAQAQHQKPGILGESPRGPLPLQGPPRLLGDPSSAAPALPGELPQGPPQCPLLPFLGTGERESLVLGTPQAVPPQAVPPQAVPPQALQGLSSSLLGSLQKPKQAESGAPSPGVSLLGEPPKDLRIPLNPYLNLQSLLPPASLRGASSKSFSGKGGGGAPGGGSQPPLAEPLLPLPPPGPPGDGFAFDCPTLLPQLPSSPGLEGGVLGGPLPPFQAGSPTSHFASGLQAGLRQSHPNKAVGGAPAGSADPAPSLGPPSSAQVKTPGGGPKRASSHLLPSPEPSPEGCYVGQHSQGLGGHYADSYLKRKRIF